MKPAMVAVLVALAIGCGARQRGSGDGTIEGTFPAAGVARVELRASDATAARIEKTAGATEIQVTGTADGGAKTTEPGQKEISAESWGLAFASKRYGDKLVISTKNEVSDIRHRYTVKDLVITVPEGVEVELITRSLTGSGAPDLTETTDE